jgi:hypothetical protein
MDSQPTGFRSVFCWGLCILAAAWVVFTGHIGLAEEMNHHVPYLPRPDHIVIVIMENRSFSDIIGNSEAPYINSLADKGALLSASYGVMHPSEPNYLALFSGSTQEIKDDSCPHTLSGPNLGSELLTAGLSFGTFSESIPSTGFTGCVQGRYFRKHNPAVNWQSVNIPAATNMPFANFPPDYNRLPTVCLVIPDIINDMHDGTIATGDKWLQDHLDAYVRWAQTHNSLLILTWDEGRSVLGPQENNHIPTILVGEMVQAGVYNRRVDHYDLLRTLLDMYGLAPIGKSANAKPLMDIWQRKTASRGWKGPAEAGQDHPGKKYEPN